MSQHHIHRSDESQTAIVKALRSIGALVWVVGKDVDLVVQHRDCVYLMDAKGIDGRLTERQRVMTALGWRVYYVRNPKEALKVLGVEAQ